MTLTRFGTGQAQRPGLQLRVGLDAELDYTHWGVPGGRPSRKPLQQIVGAGLSIRETEIDRPVSRARIPPWADQIVEPTSGKTAVCARLVPRPYSPIQCLRSLGRWRSAQVDVDAEAVVACG